MGLKQQVAVVMLLAAASGWGAAHAQEAADQLRARADRGDRAAQLTLAKTYFIGAGVPRNEGEALVWFRKAAEQGEPQAERILGQMYEAGSAGLPQDEAQAAEWFRRAAEHGDGYAQTKLGHMYEMGRGGLARDEVLANQWYAKAAGQGVASAQNKLGEAYQHGRGGLARDEEKALEWYRKAAAQGDFIAMHHAARLALASTNPKLRDTAAALEYARKAAAALPDQPEFMDTLARAYAQEGQLAEAVKNQARAVDLAPPESKAAYTQTLEEYKRHSGEKKTP